MEKFLFNSFLLILFITTACVPVFSQDRTIEINVPGNFRPVGSQGILMVKDSIISKPVIKVENLANQNMLVSIPYSPEEIEEGGLATAMLFGPAGEIAFGDVKMITDSASTKSFYSLQTCNTAPQVPSSLNQQVGLLESLVAIRAARREAHQLRLKQVLNSAFVEKLKRLEKGFGLHYGESISENSNSFVLLDRLSRLSNAIKNYQSAKK
jgi:hypothetical protein